MTVTLSDMAGITPQLRDLMPTLDTTAATALAGITATAEELNFNDTAVAGTAVASKTAVLGADKNLDELHLAKLCLGAGAGTDYTAKLIAAALNTNITTVSENGAIPVNGTVLLGHADGICAGTLAAPTAGAKIRVCSTSAFAHTVTVTDPVHFKGVGASGDEVVATFHDTGDEYFDAEYESATIWRVTAVNGVTFA